MKGSDLYSKEWCDLLFENRNKEYGAYKLRATTGRRYAIALGALLGLFALCLIPALIAFIISLQPKPKFDDNSIKKIVRFEGIRIKEARPMRRPPRKEAPELIKKDDLQDMKDIDEKENLAEILHPEDGNVDPKKIVDISKDSMETLRKEAHLALAKKEERTEGVIIDSIPRYPGGLASYMKWLNATMVYPQACIRQHREGEVTVAFIVETDGRIVNPHIIHSSDAAFNHEVLRVMHLMPRWIPGQKGGHPIRTQVTLPVSFQLSQDPFDS